jgi:endonuclease-3
LILRRLGRTYGRPRKRRWGPAVDVLVETILSQNNTGASAEAGYRRLKERFAAWDAAADSPVRDIERCIRSCGLARVKASRIRRILRDIRADRGDIDLQFLRLLPPDVATAHLRRFLGVGPKTAACVLLFAFGTNVFPVDTHIVRIARRLGVVPPAASAEKTQDLLTPLIPPADRYAMHILLIGHGRRTCRARKPLCERCVILDSCPTGQAKMSG